MVGRTLGNYVEIPVRERRTQNRIRLSYWRFVRISTRSTSPSVLLFVFVLVLVLGGAAVVASTEILLATAASYVNQTFA